MPTDCLAVVSQAMINHTQTRRLQPQQEAFDEVRELCKAPTRVSDEGIKYATLRRLFHVCLVVHQRLCDKCTKPYSRPDEETKKSLYPFARILSTAAFVSDAANPYIP